VLRKGKHNWQQTMKVDPKKVEKMADRLKWFVYFKVLPAGIAYILWIVFWIIYPDTTKTYDVWMTENSRRRGPWLMQEGDHGYGGCCCNQTLYERCSRISQRCSEANL